MKNNYNLNINPSPLDKKSIDKHKDFDALLKRVESVSEPPKNQLKVVRNKFHYWIGGIAAVLLVGILAFSNLNQGNEEYKAQTDAYFATQPFVNPPIKSLAKKVEIIRVNANEGGVYEFESGSRMVVPKAAFANSYGKLVSGEIEVHFKEYHDYVDFFLSGIPMEIEVNGKEQILESAGMIEVYATQDGERLDMIPEKSIDIELKSTITFAGNTPPDYNIYFLNEAEKEWDLKGKDEIIISAHDNNRNFVPIIDTLASLGAIMDDTENWVIDTKIETLEEINKDLNKNLKIQIAQIEKQFPRLEKPQKPEQYDGNSMTFELDFKQADLGAKNYAGTIFQVLGSQDIDKKFTSTVWEKFDLEKQLDGSFMLNLETGEQKATLKVKPVLLGNDYGNALASFESQLANYQQKNKERADKVADRKKAVTDRIAIEKELKNKSFEERMAALKEKGHTNYAANEIVKRTVTNKFQITRFGIWNCDRPLPPYLSNLDGTFLDQHFNNYQKTVVYQTDKSANTVRRFYLEDIANVQFNKNSENLLWLLTSENKLAVFYPEYFKRIDQKEGEYTFEMSLNNMPINSEADVREILKL